MHCLSKMRALSEHLHGFIENENSTEEDFQELIYFIQKEQYEKNRDEFKLILHFINNISNNHYRYPGFQSKIEQILNFFSGYIKDNFTNYELFHIYQNNKRVLLYLFETKIITVDEKITELILKHGENHTFIKYNCSYDESFEEEAENYFKEKGLSYKFYNYYFYPEIKPFLSECQQFDLKQEIESKGSDMFDMFESNRHNGENDSDVCKIIRNDSVEEFVTYVNQINLPLQSQIRESIFETNPLLLRKRPTLIEYAAFFGSIQIFQYLRLNKVALSSSLWIYAVHGNNPELIHLLEENHVEPISNDYSKSLQEAIKCHHNGIANYIIDSFLAPNAEISKENFLSNQISFGFHYHNYEFIDNDSNIKYLMVYACLFDYISIVKSLIEKGLADLNVKFLLNQSDIKLGQNCFIFCTKLTQVTIPSHFHKIEKCAFRSCKQLTEVSIPASVTIIEDCAFKDCKSIKQITIPSSVTKIGDNAFDGCTSLTQISIPPSVVSIGKSIFNECKSLKQIEIPSVRSIEECSFNECTSLTKVLIPSVTKIGNYAFYECRNLEEVSIPSSVTFIGKYAFYECISLEKISIPYSLTKIEKYTFFKCSSIKEISIPCSVTCIEENAFAGCISLANLLIPQSVQTIEQFAFRGCTSLDNVSIPNSIKVIEKGVFKECLLLNSISLPLSIQKIEDYAFNKCISLTQIKINSNVRSIGNFSFSECSSLEKVFVFSSTKISGNSFIGCDLLKKENIIEMEIIFI